MFKELQYNIEDYINNLLVNRLHKPYIVHDMHLFKINRISVNLIDLCMDDNEIQDAKVTIKTFVTDVITRKGYIIPMPVLEQDEALKVNVPYSVSTVSIPRSFKIRLDIEHD